MDILQPVVALAGWTLVMWLWMYATRIPAMAKAGIDAKQLVGGNGADLRARLPDRAGWVADNYNHLHEAPTVFYAVAIVLAIAGAGDGIAALLAWAYVGLRIAHSVVQATINRVMIRFSLFTLSTLTLIALVVQAAAVVF